MDDCEIVDLFWQRNECAIDATARKYGTYCYSIAHNILCNREDAEETVNDTYVGAWNSMPDHRPTVLSTYL
jgi:RNA polymerase sigma-70 factor (ECF subfamily)